MDWIPLIAAGITGIVAIVGVLLSIRAANTREIEQSKKDRLTAAAANYLEKSREVTEAVNLYMQSLNELGNTPKNATKITIIPPSRFPAYRRLVALQGALDQLIVVCPESIYAVAASVFKEHNATIMTLNEIDRNNRFDGEFDLIWYDAENPGEPMRSQIIGLVEHNEKVTALNRHFATQVRAELALPPINPTADQIVAPTEPSDDNREDEYGAEAAAEAGGNE